MSEVGRLGLVIGATLDNTYYKTLARSSQSVEQLGSVLKEIEKALLSSKANGVENRAFCAHEKNKRTRQWDISSVSPYLVNFYELKDYHSQGMWY